MPVLKRDRKPDLGIKSVEDKVAAGSWEMSRLNPKDNHKGPSHPALLEILKTATKKVPRIHIHQPHSSWLKWADKALEKTGGVWHNVRFCWARCRSGTVTRARLTWHDQVHQCRVQRCSAEREKGGERRQADRQARQSAAERAKKISAARRSQKKTGQGKRKTSVAK